MAGMVVSLYDFTGEAVIPWASAGYDCICYDIQHYHHSESRTVSHGLGTITYMYADLHERATIDAIIETHRGDCAFLMAFPVCTDMAVSGAAHFASKIAKNPNVQTDAAKYAMWCAEVGEALGVPYFVENPVSVLATLWRKSDYRFEPWQYGGYIPEDKGPHPVWPEYIAPFDAYPKKTCLWTGGGFAMPERKPVECPEGYSDQHKKLGGKSQKTKNIRSATPRGFAIAVHHANA